MTELSIAHRLAELRRRIASCNNSLISQDNISIIAASKQQMQARLEEAIAAGVRDFGENLVQEAAAKWPALRESHPDLTLHLIGALQTNKARQAVRLFDVIHTLDRPRLAEALAEAMAKENRPLPCLIQVNTGEELQKAGVLPQEADALIERCRAKYGLTIQGLMCVPPAGQHPAPHFALLRAIAQRHGLPLLSMGMSEDVEIAVRMGATYVRIGRALFGERSNSHSLGRIKD